jgi:broad specificity phosphatase PhoE
MLRHGESLANHYNKLAGGETDSELTKRGELQAKTLAPYMNQLAEKPVAIIHSPMKRAAKTAELVNSHIKLPMSPNTKLIEQKFGQWEGKPWPRVADKVKQALDPPGGEASAEFIKRVREGITEAITDTSHGTPLIVAHGGLFYAIAFYYNLEKALTGVKNCSLHLFEPHPEINGCPWKITEFKPENGKLVAQPAHWCPTISLKS